MKVINAVPLVNDWLCPEIIDRKSERSKIEKYILNYLLVGRHPPGAYYVTGNSGSGKTFVFKRLFKDNMMQIKKVLPRFEWIYINAIDMRTPSSASVLFNINKSLEHYLPLKFDGKRVSSIKNWKNSNTQMNFLKSIVRERQLSLVVIVDEVENIVNFEKDDGFIYSLANVRDDFQDCNFGLFPIFISNSKTLFKNIKSKTQGRVFFDDNFSNYQVDDLFELLKMISKYSLDDVDDNVLIRIAREIASTTCSVRDAKRLLFNFIELGDMDKALNALDRDCLWDDIRKLNDQQRCVLASILLGINRIDKLQTRLIPEKYKNNCLTSKMVYSIYQGVVGKENHLELKSWRTFQRMVQALRDTGIVNYQKISAGRGRGWVGAIELEYEVDHVSHLLNKANMQDRDL